MLTSQSTLFDGTLRENITLGRSVITYSDLRWALWLTELEDEVDRLPLGLDTPVAAGHPFSLGQILRILVARAMPFYAVCADEEPWSVVLISHDPLVAAHAHRQLVLKPVSSPPPFRDRDTPRQE